MLRLEMRKLLDPVQQDILALQEQITSLGNTVADQPQTNYAGITNILDNSLPEWSKDAYAATGVLPNTGGDGNLECHNFYRQLATDTELLKTTTEALKSPKTSEPAEHSLFLANEGANADIPRWDKTNGFMTLGGAANKWDIHTPLPNDIVFPGQTFYFQFETKLATADPLDPSDPTPLQFFAGLYDNTAGQRKFIEGGNFTITGEIFGDQTGTTEVEYQILAKTDSGEEAISNVLNFPNAPAVFSGANHPRIYFAGVAGFIQFLIYRRHVASGVYVHQYTVGNTIEGSYYDIGNPPIATVSGFPSPTIGTVPRAYAVTTNFTPVPNVWNRHSFTIFVPTTYNRGLTGSGMQHLRFGLTELTDTARQIQIRRIGLSQGDGAWSRSPNDLRTGAHSSPSTSAEGSAGGTGDGGTGTPPPLPPGTGGGYYCVLADTMIDIAGGGRIELQKLDREYLDSGGSIHGRIRKLKLSHASRIYRVATANRCEVGCTVTHRFITHAQDFNGTQAKVLKKRFDEGQTVRLLTRRGDETEESVIVSMREESGDFLVGTPMMDGIPIYTANGFLSHNRKANDFGDEIFY